MMLYALNWLDDLLPLGGQVEMRLAVSSKPLALNGL
jgi:hypothetical protein